MHSNGSCGHETSDFEIRPGRIDGNASLSRAIVLLIYESDIYYWFRGSLAKLSLTCPQHRFSRTVARTKRPISTKRWKGSITRSVGRTLKSAQYTTNIAILDRRKNLRSRGNWIWCVGPSCAQGCLVQTDYKDTDKLDITDDAREIYIIMQNAVGKKLPLLRNKTFL